MSQVDQINSLIEVLCADLCGCEFKWTLFVAAANSYKFDSLLKPLPGQYLGGNVLNIERLRETIDKVPRFNDLLHQLMDCLHLLEDADDQQVFDADVLDLLHWCFILNHEPKIKTVDRNNVSKVSHLLSISSVPFNLL